MITATSHKMNEKLTHHIMSISPNTIFVYGANEAGVHGKGAAKTALLSYGAVSGKYGFSGKSYGIPTKNDKIQTLPLEDIDLHIYIFMKYAKEHPENYFLLTPIGCGLAGYKPKDIVPLLIERYGREGCPSNVIFPKAFIDATQIPIIKEKLIEDKKNYLFNVLGEEL